MTKEQKEDRELSILRKLFAGISSGSSRAVEELYDLVGRDLYGFILYKTGSPEDAGDAVQEVFVRVVTKRKKLKSIKNPRSWLFTVAYRVAVDILRKKKHHQTLPLVERILPTAGEQDPEITAEVSGVAEKLEELPLDQRDTIYLKHVAGCTFSEIGNISGIPTFSAASRYRLGMKKLRTAMEERS